MASLKLFFGTTLNWGGGWSEAVVESFCKEKEKLPQGGLVMLDVLMCS